MTSDVLLVSQGTNLTQFQAQKQPYSTDDLSPKGMEYSATASDTRLAGQLWFLVTQASHQHGPSHVPTPSSEKTSVENQHKTVSSEVNTKFLFWSTNSCLSAAENKPDTDKHCYSRKRKNRNYFISSFCI